MVRQRIPIKEDSMNRSELVSAAGDRAGLSPDDVDRALTALIAAITDEVGAGGRVALLGFATFESVQREERLGRNPQTGEPMTISARRAVRITAGSALKRAATGG
jgi:DNA-binding protein HU-beta